MKSITKNSIFSLILGVVFLFTASTAMAKNKTMVTELIETDGAQTLVAAVLVVDNAGVLPFSIAELLGDKKAEIILFAPSNAAFEELLGAPAGALNGLTIDEVVTALPGLLPVGVGVAEVADILLQHVALPNKANLRRASENALLNRGEIEVADGSIYAVSIGKNGVMVNYETTIVKADNRARNGIYHFIDTVIVDDVLP